MPRPTSLSFDLLRTFIRLVANDGDASVTAYELKINQPSMSKRLGFLQHAGRVLEQPWLVREGKTWVLTEEGQRVLPAVKEIIHRYEVLLRFSGEEPEPLAPVRFACGQDSVTTFVLQALRQFQNRIADHPVRITTLRSRTRIEGVANCSLDLATVSQSDAMINKSARMKLHIRPLFKERLTIVCAEESPWAGKFHKLRKTKTQPEDVLEFPLIVPEHGSELWRSIDDMFAKRELLGSMNVLMEIGNRSTVLEYVSHGLGVGLVSEGTGDFEPHLITRHIDTDAFPPMTTKLICRKGKSEEDPDLSESAGLFYDVICKMFPSSGQS